MPSRKHKHVRRTQSRLCNKEQCRHKARRKRRRLRTEQRTSEEELILILFSYIWPHRKHVVYGSRDRKLDDCSWPISNGLRAVDSILRLKFLASSHTAHQHLHPLPPHSLYTASTGQQ
ncbi:hypothetical protein EJ06DRAFT_115820 [Trichodelitschia bisporula]|uniref:Uncharacterized protein n=1 Tax=Trichodelitschia bisporula TaxID=703511 RepID=A0A6G1HQ27_9PEZI|nr:hypothetical protein EJ06DRAFT_115820 [Trichodelitschia bisporula]